MANNVSMENFLLQYLMQMRIRRMDPQIMARYQDYIKNGDFNGHMKHWRNNLMQEVDGKWEAKPLPDPHGEDYHLTDEEWVKLFKEFRSAFRSMAADRRKLEGAIDYGDKNDTALGFLDEYFGTGKLFSQSVASPEAEAAIRQFYDIIINPSNKSSFITFLQKQDLIDYDALTKGIEDKKYNTSATFQDQLKKVIQYISYEMDYGHFSMFSGCNIDHITNGFEDDDTNLVNTDEFLAFKGGNPRYANGEYDIILRRLYGSEKIRKAFPSNKFTTAYNRAKELTGYDDSSSKDYVHPKAKDELTLGQKVSKWADDTYEDVFEKYIKFHGDRLYFSVQAKEIVSAIHKAKIKPTDGLDKVIASAAEIKKGLAYKSPKAPGHFDWFIETLGKVKEKMPKAFAGALYNGRQMKAVVSEIIVEAVNNNKVAEAKTAMEVLSVIRYGFTTSKIMETLGKEDFKLFSDKDLSWNKTNGMQFVTNALDKSIKFAFMGIGYGITIAGNAISQRGIKFNHERTGRLQNDDDLDKQRTRLEEQTTRMQDRQMAMTANRNDVVNPHGTTAANTITEANFARQQARLATDKANADRERHNLERYKRTNETAFRTVEQFNAATAEYNSANSEVRNLENELRILNNKVAHIRATVPDPDVQRVMVEKLSLPIAEKEDKLREARLKGSKAQRIIDVINAGGGLPAYKHTVDNYNNRLSRLEARDQKNTKLESRLSQWESATNAINELNTQITEKQTNLANWDNDHNTKYTELMAYWDMLETGRDFHTGKMYNWGTLSKKKAQKDFDANKDTFIADYLQQYGRVS